MAQFVKRFFIREPFSGLSHWAGVALSVVALIVLLIVAQGRVWHTVGFAIYGASLVVLYTASALYHSLHVEPRVASRLQRFDYIAIFLLIAGTYVPMCLTALHGAWGWIVLGIEYGLAAVGIIGLLVWKSAPNWFRISLYIIMGWLVVVTPLKAVLSPAGLGWLLGGGAVYSVGAIVFALDRPHLWPGKFNAHDLWHCFVLAGSGCHFMLMLSLVG